MPITESSTYTSAELIARRNALLPIGLGIFNPATVVSAEGSRMIDAEGRSLIDFAGGIGVLNAGHCPAPVVTAIQEQAARLIHSCFNVAMYDLYMQLAEELIALFPHGEHTKVLLTNSGAEAVENAIKIARQATGRSGIICFEGAFHGRSMMAMSLTSKVTYKLGCGPFAPEVYRIPFPDFYHSGAGLDYETFITHQELNLLNAFKTVVPSAEVAAIIIEPVQGEGGFNVVPARYLKFLRRVCNENGILLILDEVQSGFGRTGKGAAYEHFDVIPDLSTWAKSLGSGMPIGCLIGKAEILDKAKPSTIGGTYLGNPVCCAAAIATLEYMKKIDINEKGRHVGEIVRSRFMAFKSRFPSIGDVRGLGAMLAFELVKNGDPNQPDADLCKSIMTYAFEHGLVLINAGIYNNVIRVLSPLTISDSDLNEGLDIIEAALVYHTHA